jgi:hypothetical protein
MFTFRGPSEPAAAVLRWGRWVVGAMLVAVSAGTILVIALGILLAVLV